MNLPPSHFLLVWPRLQDKWSQMPSERYARFRRFFAEVYCCGFMIMPRDFAMDLFGLIREGMAMSITSFMIYDPLPSQPYVFFKRNYR